MSGPASRKVYTADDGTDYAVSLPDWETNLTNTGATVDQTDVNATTEPNLPKGVRRRKRYYVITATGVEGSFTVLDPASSIWTAPNGTALLVPLFGSLVVANNATLRGRTGERSRAI
jgi:hypothetical protein